MYIKTKLAVMILWAIALLAIVDPTLGDLAVYAVAAFQGELNDDYIG